MKSEMTIGKKIAGLCAVLMVFTLSVGVVAWVSMNRLGSATQSSIVDALPGIYTIDRAESAAKDIRGAMLTRIATEKPEEAAGLDSTIAQNLQKAKAILSDYEKTITTAGDRELFAKIGPALDRFMAAWEGPRGLSQSGKPQEALDSFRSVTLPAFGEFLKAIDDETDLNKSNGDEFSRQVVSAGSTGWSWIWAILLFGLVAGGAVTFLIVRSINRELGQAVQELGEGAEQLAGAASQVSSSSQSLAQGSSEQAASLEETSASSQEIKSMAHKNSENTAMVAGLVSSSQQKFVATNQALEQTVGAMGEINAQSGKISKIIKVIDEIAFQTNILALNAAVEAARAGEAGMGFAVVADEVRSLAQRCAQAAKDTAALIEESIAKSNAGKTKVDQVAGAIRVITEESSKVKTLVDEVNFGSQEQAKGIEQIGRAISQMENVTQKSAAGAEECASAAEQLSAQSQTLKDIVARLKAMVGAGDAEGPRETRSRQVGTGDIHLVKASSQRQMASSGSLNALGAAVAHKTSGAIPAPVTSGKANEDVFPLESEFKEF
jgi:methyl-accepting chemotaxis protein